MNLLEQAHSSIREFLASSEEPVLIEPGADPVQLAEHNFIVELRGGRLTLQAWDESQNIVRRVAGIANSRPGRLELAVERFGKRTGTLLLMDRRAARNHDGDRRASRLTYRESFRRALKRQFPDWRLSDLTTEPDLHHSLSPSYPRALLHKGTTGWAAIGAPVDSSDPNGALTFGLVWLDYLRRRERKLAIEGLTLFLPPDRERVTALRLRCLNSRAAQFMVFVQTGDRL
jgi:hypothetical protein